MDYFLRHSTRTMKKMPRKALRLPNNIITSILLVACAWSEKRACRMIKKTVGCWCAQNRWKKISKCMRLEWIFFWLFLRFGGYRRTPPACSCPLEHGSTWFLRARHLYQLILLATSGLAVGWVYIDIERLSSHELKENFCTSRFHSHTKAGILQYNSSGLLFVAQHSHNKKNAQKSLRLLIPKHIIMSILLVVCASSEKCACRMMKKQLAAGVHKIDEKKLYEYHCIRLEWQKMLFFLGLGGYRRTPPASSCPLQYESTWFLRAHHPY